MKLPLCPHCGARFLYSDVRQRMMQKSGVCPHCKKKYRISRRGFAIFLPAALLALFLLNFLLLQIPDMNLIFLLAVTAAGVVCVSLLAPFALAYRKL